MGLNYFHSIAPSLARHRRIVFTCAAFLLVGTSAAWNIKSWPTRLRYPGDSKAHIDGMRIAELQHFRQGIPVYAPSSVGRFDAMIYGPLYYLFASRFVNRDTTNYFPLRILGLVGTIGIAAGCAVLAYWMTSSAGAAGFAILYYLSWSIVSLYGVSVRADVDALFLNNMGFLIAYRFRNEPRIVWAAPVMLLALFYKQQFIAAPAAILVFLLLEKRYRQAAQFALLVATGGVALLALFQYIVFAGQNFFLHFVSYNIIPFSWSGVAAGLLLATPFFAIPCFLAFRYLGASHNRLFAVYLFVAISVCVAGFGKEGGSIIYFLEPITILAPLMAALVIQALAHERRIAVTTVLLGISLAPATRFGSVVPTPDDFARDRAVQGYLRANFKPATEGAAYFTGRLLRAGLAAPISDLYQYTWLACTGKISEGDWVAQLESQRFGVILLSTDVRDEKLAHLGAEICLSEPAHQALLRNYELQAVLSLPVPEGLRFRKELFVWVPKGRTRD
jgi:hypothetical protein